MREVRMNRIPNKLLAAALLPLLLVLDTAPQAPLALTLVPEAAAFIGAPLTPISYAGVARRTTRRAVVVTSAMAASSAVAAESVAVQQQAVQAAPPPAAVSPALGTVVSSLPAGCTGVNKGGIEYYQCGSVYYRTAFQGNNLVYVVQQP